MSKDHHTENAETDAIINGDPLIRGSARGTVLVSDVPLSFWGGVDPATGVVIDQHHPLSGEILTGCILAIPGGRGSCSGSGALLELILNGKAPSALVFTQLEEILTLGVLVAEIMFQQSIPVLRISNEEFALLRDRTPMRIDSDNLSASTDSESTNMTVGKELQLTAFDESLLDGNHGIAAQIAMQIVERMAKIQGAEKLIDVTQAHIDACVYNGPSSLKFAQKLVDWGAKVRVPTTLNAISVDQRRWREQNVDPTIGEPASQLADAYLAMGAESSFTCAPYLLDSAPKSGEQIVWAESNAVVFANSVIGARTQKYPDFLDICIALTGRAPASGSHLDSGRNATLRIHVKPTSDADDSFWPLLGYHSGLLAGSEIPLIVGLEETSPTRDNLKAFSASFATTSAAPMFHLSGITPEASTAETSIQKEASINTAGLYESWQTLNTATETKVDLVCLGNPHFSLTECEALAHLCKERTKKATVGIIVTMGRKAFDMAEKAGHTDTLKHFGVQFVTDTCWCMIQDPVIPPTARTLMTNSAKYAHYGPGMVGRKIHFGSLADCVNAACEGHRSGEPPEWLRR